MAKLIKYVQSRRPVDEIERILRKEGRVDVNFRDRKGRSALHWCIRYDGDATKQTGLAVIQLLLRRGASVNITDCKNRTPLVRFLKNRCNTDFIQVLLDNNADVVILDSYRNVALHHYLVKHEDIDLFRRLVQSTPDINMRNIDGQTPLLTLLARGCSAPYVEVLLNAGADVTIKADNGDTVLHLYTSGFHLKSAMSNNLDVLMLLIENGAGVNETNDILATPLMLFLLEKLPIQHVEFLIGKGADVHACDIDGDGVLHYLFSNSKEHEQRYLWEEQDTLLMLLDRGVNPNRRNFSGILPIMCGLTDIVNGSYICLLFDYSARIPKTDTFTWYETVHLVHRSGGRCILRYRVDDVEFFHHVRDPESLIYPTIDFYDSHTEYNALFKYFILEDETCFERYVQEYNRESYVAYINRLLLEVRQMKSYYIVDKVTLFDFLYEPDRRKYGYYLKTICLNFILLQKKLPEYAHLLYSKIKIAGIWADLHNKLDRLRLSSKSDFPKDEVELNGNCFKHILRFLADRDVKNLITASELSNLARSP